MTDTQTPIERDEYFLRQLTRHEGSKKNREGLHVAYLDTEKILTIGYGHNLIANPIPGLDKNAAITEKRAQEILMDDLAVFAAGLDREIPWWRKLDAPRQAVLLNMAFNMGVAGLLTFHRTLRAVREMRWGDARDGMLASKWASDVGRRAPELAMQMLTGEWQKEMR